uniref:Uncharacterized protein n=1 Tax=Oryza brachyantha TaxID=4533 RepID=J3LMM1_ORYBR
MSRACSLGFSVAAATWERRREGERGPPAARRPSAWARRRRRRGGRPPGRYVVAARRASTWARRRWRRGSRLPGRDDGGRDVAELRPPGGHLRRNPVEGANFNGCFTFVPFNSFLYRFMLRPNGAETCYMLLDSGGYQSGHISSSHGVWLCEGSI